MIRPAVLDDLNAIMEVIEDARYNLKNAGLNQWNLDDGYPTINTMIADIDNNNLFVYDDNNPIKGIISIVKEIDINYQINNFWKTNNKYLSLHRIAIRNNCLNQGIASSMFDFAENYAKSLQINEIRIDTHNSNIKMKNLIKKHNYKYVGVIKLLNSNFDNLRNAYYKII